ncbi:hypothetical protein [[Limnothrix rosea] IAM M-220]|uniref:hypothetical protein n=1 Tax=[Limnothrix rosea] IAM M-220 TaxID=454133 RepID=UPI0009641B66|nr:hypothetical protein [[Limnothrix rosea] IAM M-220]OKH16999.1 hypothetical protein NIES208_10940 [[Limnothrix rosea] IAM M-220]
MTQLLDHIGDWNPQLFRELKGRFRRRNLAIAIGTSLVAQLLMLLGYLGSLPDPLLKNTYSRYCTGYNDEYWRSSYECIATTMGDTWDINWQLWNLDLFVCLTIVGMGLLLIVGSHLISADLIKEEKRGTMGFVRLSPQALHRIIIGKILGVPSLVYLGIALALPLHFWAGLQAGIALPWIGMVYLVAIAACIASYSLSTMWSFVGQDFFGGFQAWLYSGALGFYLMIMTIAGLESNLPSNTPFDWLRMFYPGNIFYYLVDGNSLDVEMVHYFEPNGWFAMEWFHSTGWSVGLLGLGLMAGHYFVLTAIAWQGIQRRFYEPQATMISKRTAYAVAILTTFLMTGFAAVGEREYRLMDNFETLQVFSLALFFSLTFCLTPTRQRVQDWFRDRHTGRYAQRFWSDLLWGDRSPALLAIGVMLLLSTGLMAIVAANDPFLESKIAVIQGLILQAGFLFICACIVQFIFLQTRKRNMMLVASLGTLTIAPFLIFVIFNHRFPSVVALGLFSAFPIQASVEAISALALWAIAGQWVAMVAGARYIQTSIHRLGASELKTLLTPAARSSKNVLT